MKDGKKCMKYYKCIEYADNGIVKITLKDCRIK